MEQTTKNTNPTPKGIAGYKTFTPIVSRKKNTVKHSAKTKLRIIKAVLKSAKPLLKKLVWVFAVEGVGKDLLFKEPAVCKRIPS